MGVRLKKKQPSVDFCQEYCSRKNCVFSAHLKNSMVERLQIQRGERTSVLLHRKNPVTICCRSGDRNCQDMVIRQRSIQMYQLGPSCFSKHFIICVPIKHTSKNYPLSLTHTKGSRRELKNRNSNVNAVRKARKYVSLLFQSLGFQPCQLVQLFFCFCQLSSHFFVLHTSLSHNSRCRCI